MKQSPLQLDANKSQIEKVLSLKMMKVLQTKNIEKNQYNFNFGKNRVLIKFHPAVFTFLKLNTKSKNNLITTTVSSEPQAVNVEEPSAHNPNF